MPKLQVISPFEYNPTQDPANVTFLQGIKGGDQRDTYLLTGSINATGPGSVGLVYEGPLDSVQRDGVSGSGTWYTINVPETGAFTNVNGTSVYGPDNLGAGLVDLVGAYTRNVSGGSASGAGPPESPSSLPLAPLPRPGLLAGPAPQQCPRPLLPLLISTPMPT
ncbi:hypothetical protein [Synechococcus sp. CBW1006]|uniref:hypothetical protein n=1 Tax=Synechococcus sp. CBW1006 TaxID=1353138 RepID=UPI0018CC877D|nr:hypothetical protein [Synechococcus sp. CBW1006]QPN67454.1 hypothetical protein H8F26_04435 [Synechococcus sp. CBW1006]